MENTKIMLLLALYFLSSCQSQILNREVASKGANVIIVTIDGVRWQEFFEVKDRSMYKPTEASPYLMPKLWTRYAEDSFIVGNRLINSEMLINNKTRVSLPGYQAIFSGQEQVNCKSNKKCPQLETSSFFDRVKEVKNFSFHEVAAIASWKKLDMAVTNSSGSFYVKSGKEMSQNAGFNYIPGKEVDVSHTDQETGWKETGWDATTVDMGLQYIEQFRPKLFLLSLGESDEYAHQGKKTKYLKAITKSDEYLDLLFKKLKEMGSYGENTTVLITTDHGRGNENLIGSWKHHGPFRASKYVWLWAYGKNVRGLGMVPTPKRSFSHGDIRPTIEKIFGLTENKCEDKSCGSSIDEITED